jgi:hypothetical protein
MELKIKDKVEALLAEKPHLRDDDHKLVANIWYKEAIEKGLNIDQIQPILRLIAQGILTSSESITRSRRKVQEDNEHLRGKDYTHKQNHQVNVQAELGYNV